MLDPGPVLALYDQEIRRNPVVYPGVRIETVGPIVRCVGEENMVLYSDLTAADAPGVVAEQARFFRELGVEAEWKSFGHDRPPELPALLASEGFEPDEPETLVAWDLNAPGLSDPPPGGVTIRPVRSPSDLEEAEKVNREAFGSDSRSISAQFAARLHDPMFALFVAYVDGVPAATGRLEMPDGKSFAGLYGGGTDPRYRHRGLYRSLVNARAAVARARGYRYLTVDARITSLPILLRLGFVPLTTTRGWVLHAP